MNPTPSIVACELKRGFTVGKIRQEVIRGLSVEVFAGELTLVMGPSGSGKTTLLAMLSGLLRPDSGRVKALGTDITALDDSGRDQFRLRHSGFIFQGFNLFASLTALDQVLLALRYEPNPAGNPRARAQAALAEVELADRAHLRPAELSVGEKQRVAIARAMIKAPQLLFADEPTSSLDSANGERIIALLQRLAREHGATVLCVTHNPELIEHADRVIDLHDGMIVRDRRQHRLLSAR